MKTVKKQITRIKNVYKNMVEYVKFHMAIGINEPFYSFIIFYYNMFAEIKHKSDHKTISKNKPIYYVIRINDGVCGYASFYDMVIGQMLYCKRKGYIPVVDLSSSDNTAIYDSQMQGNPWEYYFEQPMVGGKRHSLEEAYKSDNYIISNNDLVVMYKRINSKIIARRRKVANLIPYNSKTQEYFKQHEKEVLSLKDDSGIIGAYYRGTDYKQYSNWTPMGHAMVPPIEKYADELEKYAIEKKCKNIFFMTDEQEAIDYVVNRFSKDYRIVFIPHPRYSNFKGGKAVSAETPMKISRYDNNLYYLMDIDILSKCTYLFGTKNAGYQMALNLNGNKYSDIKLLTTGFY